MRRVYVESHAVGLDVLTRLSTDVVVREIRDGTLAKVLDVVSPNSVVSVADIDPVTVDDLVELASQQHLPLVVLVDVGDPGNVGTILRVAEAAGVAGVVIAGRSADPYAPKVVRASAGSLFRVPLAMTVDVDAVLDRLADAGSTTLAAAGGAGRAPDVLDLGGEFALVMGSEAHGLARGVIEACDETVSIPMAGAVESLNVAMATTVVLFEAARQRRNHGGEATI